MFMKKKIVCASPYFRTRSNIWYSADFPEYEWDLCYPIHKKGIKSFIGIYNFSRISKIKQAVEVAMTCRGSTVLAIIIDEKLTFWSLLFMPKTLKFPVISWSFNYHTLPCGLRYRLMRRVFQKIDLFIVHSTFDKRRYAKHFDLDPDKIDVLLWGMPKPKVDEQSRFVEKDYLCALGENARDYQTLVEAMRNLPDIQLELVVRPYNLKGLVLPPNVRTHVNISHPQAMNILYHSRFMVLPLQGSEVSNGHVTLVAAQHLGKAMIVTDSVGISDYISAGKNVEVYPAFNVEALTNHIKHLWHNPKRCEMLGKHGQAFASKNLTEKNVKAHLRQVLNKYLN